MNITLLYQSCVYYEIKRREYLETSFLTLLIFSMHVTVNQPCGNFVCGREGQ